MKQYRAEFLVGQAAAAHRHARTAIIISLISLVLSIASIIWTASSP